MDEFRLKAGERMAAGEADLFDFIAKTPTKTIEELIARMWDFQGAAERASQPHLTRLEKLRAAAQANCEETCGESGKWYFGSLVMWTI